MAYRRADKRGDPAAATRLGELLEQQGDLAGAAAAYRRASDAGTPPQRSISVACSPGMTTSLALRLRIAARPISATTAVDSRGDGDLPGSKVLSNPRIKRLQALLSFLGI